MHLFCNCRFVQMFWCDVSDWLSVKFFYNFNFENRHKLFGFLKNNDIFQFINAFFLYARFLIYRYKYSTCKPNISGVARNLKRKGQDFYIFFQVCFFFGEANLKQIEKQNRL